MNDLTDVIPPSHKKFKKSTGGERAQKVEKSKEMLAREAKELQAKIKALKQKAYLGQRKIHLDDLRQQSTKWGRPSARHRVDVLKVRLQQTTALLQQSVFGVFVDNANMQEDKHYDLTKKVIRILGVNNLKIFFFFFPLFFQSFFLNYAPRIRIVFFRKTFRSCEGPSDSPFFMEDIVQLR